MNAHRDITCYVPIIFTLHLLHLVLYFEKFLLHSSHTTLFAILLPLSLQLFSCPCKSTLSSSLPICRHSCMFPSFPLSLAEQCHAATRSLSPYVIPHISFDKLVFVQILMLLSSSIHHIYREKEKGNKNLNR